MCTAAVSRVADPAPPTSGAGQATAPYAVTAWGLTGGGGPDASAHSCKGRPDTGAEALTTGSADGGGEVDGGADDGGADDGGADDGGADDGGELDIGADDALVGEPDSVASGPAVGCALDEQPANPIVTKTITAILGTPIPAQLPRPLLLPRVNRMPARRECWVRAASLSSPIRLVRPERSG
jgi:hypothetical protein